MPDAPKRRRRSKRKSPKTTRDRGRPPEPWDPDKVNDFLLCLRGGNYVDVALDFAGISRSTYYSWSQKARECEKDEHGQPTNPKDRIYVDFMDRVAKALADSEVAAMGRIERAARGGAVKFVINPTEEEAKAGKRPEVIERVYAPVWQADAWRLERRYPERYARVDRTEVSGRGGGPIQLDASAATSRLMGFFRQLASRRGTEPDPAAAAELETGRPLDAE